MKYQTLLGIRNNLKCGDRDIYILRLQSKIMSLNLSNENTDVVDLIYPTCIGFFLTIFAFWAHADQSISSVSHKHRIIAGKIWKCAS